MAMPQATLVSDAQVKRSSLARITSGARDMATAAL